MWSQSTETLGSPGRHFDFTVYCPVEKSLLAIIRRFILSVTEEMNFADDDILKIEMAVDEACANVTQHAYGGNSADQADGADPPPKALELRLSLDPDGLTIRIQDRGRGDLPDHLHGAPSLEDYQRPGREEYHGLGILIMKQFMDDVQISGRPGAGVTVTMRKLLRASMPLNVD